MSETRKVVLITGATGWLGQFVYKELQCSSLQLDIHAIYHSAMPEWGASENWHYLDLSDSVSIDSLISKILPDIVLHLAALSSPVACHKNPKLAFQINRPTALVTSLSKYKSTSLLIFSSTDLVYDGEHAPYNTSAVLSPKTVYGQTKASFEEDVLTLENGVVLRLSNMIGPKFQYQYAGCKFLQFLNEAWEKREYVSVYIIEP